MDEPHTSDEQQPVQPLNPPQPEPSAPQPQQIVEPAQVPAPNSLADPAAPAQDPIQYTTLTPAAPKKTRKKSVIVLAIVTTLLLLLGDGVAATYFFVIKENTKPEVVKQPRVEKVEVEKPASEAIGTPYEVDFPEGTDYVYVEPVFIE